MHDNQGNMNQHIMGEYKVWKAMSAYKGVKEALTF